MTIEQPATEADMVALFLAAELQSHRWAPAIRAALSAQGVLETIVTAADTADAAANAHRDAVLDSYRQYRQRRGLFQHYPDDVCWQWVRLQPSDFRRLKYIEYSYWNELTGGTRRPLDAVTTIRRGTEVYGVSNGAFLAGEQAVRAGACFDPLILVAPSPTSDLVILEGHSRATVYALAGRSRPAALRALLGVSPGFAAWV